MPLLDLITEVLDKDLCAGCGICAAACPETALEFDTSMGAPSPRRNRSAFEVHHSICGTCSDCLNVCPGSDPATTRSEVEVFGRTRTADERWLGIVEDVRCAQAKDPELFEHAASGGAVTGLLLAAMQTGAVSIVLAAGRERDRPWRAATAICRSREDLLDCCQSTYQLFPHLEGLRTVLETPNASIAIVGLACHMQAIRKLQAADTELGKLARSSIHLLVEIACSSNTRPSGLETLIENELPIPISDVSSVRFRDGEYPGNVVVRDVHGTSHQIPFWHAVRHFKDHKTHRCLSCGDWMSGLADVSVCDGDPNIFKSSQYPEHRVEKHGLMLVRTDRGRALVREAEHAGILETWPGSIAKCNLGLDRKRNRRAYFESLELPISQPPVPGFKEDIEIVDDSRFIPAIEEGSDS